MKRMIWMGLLLAGCAGGADDTLPPADGNTGDSIATDTTRVGSDDTAADSAAVCGVGPEATLSGEGVGDFRIGRPAAELTEACQSAAEREITDNEGGMQPVVELRTAGGSVQAQVVDGNVWRVHVTDPAITTAQGLHVGSTLTDLLRFQARGMVGEGELFVAIEEACGMSFRLNEFPASPPAGGSWTEEALGDLGEEVRVDEILAFGCG